MVRRPGFVAVDLGATSGRVMLGIMGSESESEGPPSKVELVECGRFANGPRADDDGALRWDVRALWGGILDGLRSAGRVASERGVEIRGVGVDSWAIDHAFLDASGDLVADPFCYRDPRTDGVADEVYRRIPFADHYAVNGLQHLPFTTEFQLVAGVSTGSTTEKTGSASGGEWARAEQLLLIPDLIGYWLTGRRVAEVTNASTTGLLDARTRTWSAELLGRLAAEYPELAGLRDRLPELVEPGAAVGHLLPEVQEATGLGDVPVLAIASHDTASAVAATPLRDGAAYISSGTWSLVGLELPAPVLTKASRAANFTNELGLDGTVRYLRNVMGLWVLDECVRAWSADDGAPVDLPGLLDAAAAEPGGRCLVDVDGDEFLAPGDMPRRVSDAVARLGVDLPGTRPALVRVILDSLAASSARAISDASSLAGVVVSAVHVVGGGSQNELLCRLTSKAAGLPVIAGPVEATALGNVLVQARAVGVVSGDLAALRDVVRSSVALRRYDPEPVR
ncbi:rhamnulokinase [Promicromonospora soli]|uniref:Carbohydrate kinase n=1 Tax=Promicromonospora soli TaxID=2035533 RepID=A0A919FMC4_9MICO|nr:rhamnulokinase family protein [Promicromonospora soli]GHH68992.1 carbohydrate kinase [Promicromonospora soli]